MEYESPLKWDLDQLKALCYEYVHTLLVQLEIGYGFYASDRGREEIHHSICFTLAIDNYDRRFLDIAHYLEKLGLPEEAPHHTQAANIARRVGDRFYHALLKTFNVDEPEN